MIEQKQKSDGTDKLPIWMLVESLTFGEILFLLKLMSNKRLNNIAKKFNCNQDELISWLSTINFIRNQCAHNHKLVDIHIKTKPKIREEWKSWLLFEKNNTTGNLAEAIIPMVYLIPDLLITILTLIM